MKHKHSKVSSRAPQTSLGTLWRSVLPHRRASALPGMLRRAILWPPDVFALAAFALRESGAYRNVVRQWPPSLLRKPERERYPQFARELGLRWRNDLAHPPALVREWWLYVLGRLDATLTEVCQDEALWGRLALLLTVADESSWGVGLPEDISDDYAFECYLCMLKALESESPATLCRKVMADRLLVLPKLHVPQSGITIRSLSHNLALCDGGDVIARWSESLLPTRSEVQGRKHGINLLLLPLPEEILPNQFHEMPASAHGLRTMAEGYGFFGFRHHADSPAARARICRKVLKALTRAERSVGAIDGVVMPEAAMSPALCRDLARVLRDRVSFFVAGVYQPANGGVAARNYAHMFVPVERSRNGRVRMYLDIEQDKHHRWLLDGSQITKYGLGSSLDPQKKWWEGVDLKPREVHFVPAHPRLTFSVLICEDLARPDPVGDLLRSVGPNLVIALLQDGPQSPHRWSAVNAAVLADDPGSSVLTLTSLGMARLGEHIDASPRELAVALWKEKGQSARKLCLPPGKTGLVLSLNHAKEVEWTADGRSDEEQEAGAVRLAGVLAV
jgi:hypothetical protein